MKKNFFYVIAIVLVLMMIPTSVNAANFKDVSNTHWAKSYIDNCVKEGIINGYPDGTFKPNGDVKFTELSVLLAKLINVTEAEMQLASQQYSGMINNYEIAKWAKPSILGLLYKGVYDEDVVKKAASIGMLKDGSNSPVIRSNVAVFVAKALGVQENSYALTYKDANKINVDIQKYIAGLQNIGVLSKQGDDKGYFRPESGVTRAEIAKMLTVGLEHIKKNGNSVSPTPAPTPSVPSKTITGIVKNIIMYNGYPTIIIEQSNGKAEACMVDITKQVTVDGTTTLYTGIKENMEATVIVANNKLQSGTFKTNEKKLAGEIKKVGYNGKFDIEYKEGNITKTETFDFSDAKIKRDNKDAKYSDLREKDTLEFTIYGNVVKEVNAKAGMEDFDGYFYSIEKDRYGDYIVNYTTEYNNNRTDWKKLYLQRNDYFYLDGQKIRIDDIVRDNYRYIVKGQPIKFKYEGYRETEVNEIITVYEGNIKDGIITGYIVDDVRSSDEYIRISSKVVDRYWTTRDKYTEIAVESSTDVRYDRQNKRAYTSDLRRNTKVKVDIRNGVAYYIYILDDINSSASDGRAEGEVYGINTRDSVLDIDFDDYYKHDFRDESHAEFKYNDSTKFYIDSQVYTKTGFENMMIKKSKDISGDKLTFRPEPKIEFEYKIDGYGKYLLTEVRVTFR